MWYILNDCSTIALLSSVLELDVIYMYDWQMTPPNTHHSYFPTSHLCVHTHITWRLQVICGRSAYGMIALLLDTFLMWFRVVRENQLESYGPRHASVVVWYIAILCTTMHDNKTHVPYDCIIHTKRRLYCQRCIILEQQSWLATLHAAVSFQLIMYTNITTIYTALWVCTKQQEKRNI